jgi:hypothetical protein
LSDLDEDELDDEDAQVQLSGQPAIVVADENIG